MKTVLWYKRAVEEVVVLDMWSLAAVNTWHLTQPSSFDFFLDNAREELKCSDMSETCAFSGYGFVERVDVDVFLRAMRSSLLHAHGDNRVQGDVILTVYNKCE